MPKISNPPQTEDPNLNFILLEMIRELNLSEENYLKLLADVEALEIANAASATNTTNADHILVVDNENADENNLIPFIEDATATGNVGLESDGDFHYNPSTGTVTATTFSGNFSGSITNATTATNANHVSVADNESTDENNLIPFIEDESATGNVGLESDGDLTYNPSTGRLTATQLAGTLQTASQTNITGVGTITTGVWNGTAIADSYISSSATWNAKVDTGGTGLTKAGTTLNVDAAQSGITSVGTLTSLTTSGDITFEGATADDFETTFTVTDPTADRTITLPDATGQVVLSDGAIDTNASAEIGRAHIGSVGHDDYAGFSHIDANGTGTYALRAGSSGQTMLNAATGSAIYFRYNDTDTALIGYTGLYMYAGKTLKFEGATANDYETTLTVTDPTADRTITFPDATGQVVLSSGAIDTDASAEIGRAHIGNMGFSGGSDYAGFSHIDQNGTGSYALLQGNYGGTYINAPTGLVIDFRNNNSGVAHVSSGGLYMYAGKNFYFEGSTANNFETTLTVTDPTQDNTITLPDATGTVVLTSDIGSKPHFVKVSSEDSDAAAVRYIKVATINSSTPSNSNSTFVFRILLEGRAELAGASQFRVHIRSGDTAAKSSVVVEQEHSNRHTYYGIDSFIFFHNSQSNSEFWVKIPNNGDTAYQQLFAKLEVSAPEDTEFVSGHDDVTIHTSQSWTTSAPTGTNEVTAEWIKKRFDSIIFEGSTTNTFETFLEAADPGADRTITLPDATGTVHLHENSDERTLLATTTLNDSSTCDFSSTYITDTYNTYDVVFVNVHSANDSVALRCRMGDDNSADSAYTYSYYGQMRGTKYSDSVELVNYYDNSETYMSVTPNDVDFYIGNHSSENFNGHIRFFNLRENDLAKGFEILSGAYRTSDSYWGTWAFGLGWDSGSDSAKKNYLSFFLSSGNFTSGTVKLYGLNR